VTEIKLNAANLLTVHYKKEYFYISNEITTRLGIESVSKRHDGHPRTAVFRQRLKTFLFSRSYPDIVSWRTNCVFFSTPAWT